jgi:hypothetical protein
MKVPTKISGEKRPGFPGECNPGAKLTDEQVIELRLLYLAGTKYTELSRRYTLPIWSLQDITTGKTWKHLLGIRGCPTLEELKQFARDNQKSSAKINQEIATEIRMRLAAGEVGTRIAEEFELHKTTVYDIKFNRTWRE